MASEKVQPGLVIAGRYRVERQLGEGGMGSVFLVRHVHTDEQLAVKVLHKAVVEDASALERFQREARTPARIDSDHVVRVTDADVAAELGGAPFLVMELLRGHDLDQLVTARGTLSPSEVVVYLRQAARALDKAHALGVIHRDLKPENLFLTEREDGTPCVKVLDFGIAKLTGGGDIKTKTATGEIFGTPMFMSPEQALGENAKVSAQTDVWALGLIAHKLLTGADIWTAPNLTALLGQIAYQPMPVPSAMGVQLGQAYDAWFARCCAREVTARYASAGEAVTELAGALGVREAAPGRGSASGAVVGAPAGDDAALARTSLPGDTRAPLGHTAGPLTRDPPSAAPRRRAGVLWGAAAGALGVAAGAAWLFLGAGAAGPDPAPATQERTAPSAEALASSATPDDIAPASSIEITPAPSAAEPASAAEAVSAPPAPSAPPPSPPAPPRTQVAPPPRTQAAPPPPAPTTKPPADPLKGRY